MASMRKLRRRLLAWERYAARIGYHLGNPYDDRWTAYDRAETAVETEWQRRRTLRAAYRCPAVVDAPDVKTWPGGAL